MAECAYKIVAGFYLTGKGQENQLYYFKLAESQSGFQEIRPDMICGTFLQDETVISPIVSVIRVERVIEEPKRVARLLRQATQAGVPLMPIFLVDILFEVDHFSQMQQNWSDYFSESVQALSVAQPIVPQKKEVSQPKSVSDSLDQLSLFD